MLTLVNGQTQRTVSEHDDDDLADAMADADYFNELPDHVPYYILNSNGECVYMVGFKDD